MDIFYCKTLASETFIVLGMVDRATGLHQAIILPDRNSDTAFQCFEKIWLRPFGVPVHISCDPDKTFRGSFESRVQAMGCIIEHCPPEAHHVIGMIERRNALLRTILEKLIDQFGAATLDECSALLAAACHAINTGIHTHGRSAYQAVFGRQPRLMNSNFNDPMVLATSEPVAQVNQAITAGYKAEFIRCEALKRLHELDCSQHLRRALLRKTRATKIADLQPGQPCAYWRWTRRGAKKRGSWVMARFLSWDPSHVGKQAWLRTGASTTLVTAEQLRAAFGFEDWVPDKEDAKALKDAATKFESLMDDRGPEPEPSNVLEDEDMEWPGELGESQPPMTPSMAVVAPSTPATQPSPVPPPVQPQQPHTPTLPSLTQQQLSSFQQQQQSVQFNIDSPTNITNNQLIQQQYHRYGTMPERSRRRSRTPTSKRLGSTAAEQTALPQPEQQALQPAEQPAIAEQPALHDIQSPPAEQTAAGEEFNTISQTPAEVSTQAVSQHTAILDCEQTAEQTLDAAPQQADSQQTTQVITVPADDDVQHIPSSGSSMSANQLPQKRPFDSMFSLAMDEMGRMTIPHHYWDGSPPIGFGPAHRRCHQAYLTTPQRLVSWYTNKQADESDTTQDSDTDESTAGTDTGQAAQQHTPAYKQGMSRQELKALDREIPWRRILEAVIKEAVIKEAVKESDSWATWESVEPLPDSEAEKILSDPVLKRRVIKSRACYRDKSLGIGDIKAKCRIVALGHLDPDLSTLTRHTATPGRIAEHVVYSSIVAGYNSELFGSGLSWIAWSGDAATAFLQGQQAERHLPLFMLPPKDGLISLTNTWQNRLYRVRGNIYGLANAPFTWSREVIRRLESLNYCQHSFDKQLFYKVDNGQIMSMILVYVDDFIGLHRSDYDINEVHTLFKWGSLSFFEENKAVVFKGKELTLTKNESHRYVMKITMTKFIEGLNSGKLHRGRLQGDPALTLAEQKALRSVTGCLQWLRHNQGQRLRQW